MSDHHEPIVNIDQRLCFCSHQDCDWTHEYGSVEALESWNRHLTALIFKPES